MALFTCVHESRPVFSSKGFTYSGLQTRNKYIPNFKAKNERKRWTLVKHTKSHYKICNWPTGMGEKERESGEVYEMIAAQLEGTGKKGPRYR